MGAGRSPPTPCPLHQLSPAKPEHTGAYVCTAHSALGSAQARVDVTVETAQQQPGAPQVTAPSSITVVAGDTATLHCTATGTGWVVAEGTSRRGG